VVAEILQVAGLVLIVVAASLVWVPLGVFVAGAALLTFGLLMDPRVRLGRK
jgi:hypothetical protein